MFVYKILTSQEWIEAKDSDVYKGSILDQKDGFIHLSTREQLAETLALYFHKQTDLSLLSFLIDDLDNLKWEESRANQLFPHLYAELPMHKKQEHWFLELNEEGRPLVPWA